MSETVEMVCPYPECGQEFTDPRRYEYHTNTCVKNPNKVGTTFTVNRTPPTAEKKEEPKKASPAAPSAPAKKPTPLPTAVTQNDVLRVERSQKWTQYIVNDLNPMLFTGVSKFADIPAEWADSVIFEGQGPDGKTIKLWDPSLRTRLTFSEGEAKRLADAASRFSVSPMGMAIHAWIESNAGMIALVAAGVVAAKYGWRVMQTKAEVAQIKEMMQKQMEMMAAQQAMSNAANAGEANNGVAA